jgi:hypothetical protein
MALLHLEVEFTFLSSPFTFHRSRFTSLRMIPFSLFTFHCSSRLALTLHFTHV